MSQRARKREERRSLRILMRSVFGIGVACLVFAVWHAWQVNRCKSWPRTDAVVSRLSFGYTTNVLGHNKWRPIRVSEHIDFRYVYEVDGRKFESSRFFYLLGYPPGYELRERFLEGTRFRAFCHPDDPSVAIVEPEHVSYAAFAVGFGLVSISGLVLLGKIRGAVNQPLQATAPPGG